MQIPTFETEKSKIEDLKKQNAKLEAEKASILVWVEKEQKKVDAFKAEAEAITKELNKKKNEADKAIEQSKKAHAEATTAKYEADKAIAEARTAQIDARSEVDIATAKLESLKIKEAHLESLEKELNKKIEKVATFKAEIARL